MTPAEYDLVATLVKLDPDVVLLPSLQILQLLPLYGMPIYATLASRSLHTLDITSYIFHFDEELLQGTLQVLVHRAPHIRVICAKGTCLDGMLLLDFASKFPQLRELSMEASLSTPLLRRLGGIASVESLDIDIREEGKQWDDSSIRFTHIRKLTCSGRCGTISTIIPSLVAPELAELEIKPAGYADAIDSYANLLRNISTSHFARSLRALTISIWPRWVHPVDPMPLATFLRPCLRLSQIERLALDLNVYVPISTSDDDFRTLASAFPNLRRFVLRRGARAHTLPDTPPSLATLTHFARHCPELRELEMQGIEVGLPSDADVPEMREHPCRVLRLSSSSRTMPVRDVVRVALFLDGLFPNLDIDESHIQDVERLRWGPVVPAMSWEEVSDILRARHGQRRVAAPGWRMLGS